MYVGDLVWNRRTDARIFQVSNGRATERREAYGPRPRLVPNPEEDWIHVEETQTGIVSRRVFDAAKPTRRRSGAPPEEGATRAPGALNGRRARYLPSGLVECARCGGRYQGVRRTKGKRRKDGSPVQTFYYGCGNYVRKGRAACRLSRTERLSLIDDCQEFVPLLGSDLTSPSPEVRIRALRRRVQQVAVSRAEREATIQLNPLPVGGPWSVAPVTRRTEL
jgi:hypothetical protein